MQQTPGTSWGWGPAWVGKLTSASRMSAQRRSQAWRAVGCFGKLLCLEGLQSHWWHQEQEKVLKVMTSQATVPFWSSSRSPFCCLGTVWCGAVWGFPPLGCKLYQQMCGDLAVGKQLCRPLWPLCRLQLCNGSALDGRHSYGGIPGTGAAISYLYEYFRQSCFRPWPMVILKNEKADFTHSSKQLLFTHW